jgi:A/G-specific adenine glycosylase
MQLSLLELNSFINHIWDYYAKHGRIFDWRHEEDPYKIIVSEIMLQQTQTHRVVVKYPPFIAAFSTIETLAQAPLKDVLALWQGLGYNRRGMYLHQIAQKVVQEYAGNVPDDPAILVTFPGLGKATAASICAFAFNKPTCFIETNIRAVYIHFFFQGKVEVTDADIMPLIQATLDYKNPREWYYALMDYGVMLKKSMPNPSRKSAHYTTQSKFEGSDRQIRGMILKLLVKSEEGYTFEKLCNLIDRPIERIKKASDELCKERLITLHNSLFTIL